MKLRLLLLAALLLSSPAPVQARPVSVVLYPSGALVTEEETLPAAHDAVLTLPADADAESLSVTLSSGTVLESRLRTEHAPSPAMKALQKELEEVRVSLSRAAAERESVSLERLFWADPPVTVASGDAEALKRQAQETQRRLAELAQRDTELDARERALEKNVRALEARMEDMGRNNDAVQTCALVIDGKGPVTARWTYVLPGASWQPVYRVDAGERRGTVRISMNAVLSQRSGEDWKDVDVTLSSAEDLHSVEPPALPVWTEGEARPVLRSANLMAAKAADAKSAVSVQSHAAGLCWSLGRMDVPAEGRITRPVAVHELPAAFCRVLRPLQDDRAYVAAVLTGETPPLLPSGQAVFSIDGRENARGLFRLDEGGKEIFFGVDQLVTARTRQLPAKETDLPSDVKARMWHWRTDITSGHDSAVSVRVEAPAPVLRDARMTVRTKSRPAAEFNEEKACVEWILDVPARGTADIMHEVTVTSAPESSGDRS